MLFYSPSEEEGLVKIVEDINNDVIVGSCIKIRTGKFFVDQNSFLRNSERRNRAVRYFPRIEEVRILSFYYRRN